MDQLRQVLDWVKQQHFWLLSLLVTIVGLFSWYAASSDLREQYAAAKSKIEKEFTSTRQLTSVPFHPNQEVNKAQLAQVEMQAENVKQLWERLYSVQQDAVLQWPDALGPDFQQYISQLKFGAEIHQDYRRIYTDYAKGHFPQLPKIVKALELPAGVGTGAMGRTGGSFTDMGRIEEMMAEGRLGDRRNARSGEELAEVDLDFIVVWQDQEKVRQSLNFVTVPSPIRIWVTQEDLWVYTALLNVIANTNKAAGATRMSNAAIRVIDSLEVGSVAAQTSRGKGRILMPEQTSGGRGGGEGEYYGESMDRGSAGVEEYYGGREGAYMTREGGFADAGENEAATLLSMRYLDDDGKPISVSGQWDPGDFGEGFKQLPIRMMLQMDHRWLYHLVSECANAPLQIEVEEVRVNVSGTGGSGGRIGFGSGSHTRMYSLQPSGGRGGGLGIGLGGRGAEINAFNRQPHIVPVIIQGTITIYNEPDPSKLDVDGAAV